MSHYDGWAYLGRESYGSRHVSRSSVKPGTKFFDVLGRAYDKMKAKIKYYVYKDSINVDSFDVPLEFEVYGRVIKDDDGNNIQLFFKEDKANGLRRDSSFYWDGSWDVFEFDESADRMILKNSLGMKSWSVYDDKKRLTESYLIDENGDTLISEQYKWQNDRLAKTTMDGVERVFVYGKTLQDTVRVIPSDGDLKSYYSGYDGTAGRIPDSSEPEYKRFAMSPYRYLSFSYEENESSEAYFAAKRLSASLAKASSVFLDTLGATITRGCVSEDSDMPDAFCVRYKRGKIIDNEENRDQGRNYGYPGSKGSLFYGESDAQPYFDPECRCGAFGKYRLSFSGYTINEYIGIMQSTWKYSDREKWHERCWERGDLQGTYRHEAHHIKNARNALDRIIKSTSQINFYDTEDECLYRAETGIDLMHYKWYEWYKLEKAHGNFGGPYVYLVPRRDRSCGN